MAALNVTAVPVDGGLVDVAAAAVAATVSGDTAPTGPGRFLYVNNASGGAVTATIATPGTVSGLDVENAALVVPAGKHGLIPLSRVFAGATGRAAVTYSAVTTVTVAVLELGA
ncbi:hypothetical protein [Streptomyces phaeochromogenes]